MSARNASDGSRFVNATVRRYFSDKGFGFAEIIGVQGPNEEPVEVFFHESACRKVTGTTENPFLTDERNRECVHSGPNATQLFMKIAPSDKGLKAVAWGSVPHGNWLDDLIDSGGLTHYIGGGVGNTRNHGSNFTEPEYEGVLEGVELTHEQLKFTLFHPKTREPDGRYVSTGDERIEFTYELAFARPNTLTHGRYAIILPSNRRITFYPRAIG